jgi:hypothetical protein
MFYKNLGHKSGTKCKTDRQSDRDVYWVSRGKLVIMDMGYHLVLIKSFLFYCQTPMPGQTWDLTLFSYGNKKKKNPHPNSPRRCCARVLKCCMWPSDTKRIRLHSINFDTNFFTQPIFSCEKIIYCRPSTLS